MLPRVSTIFDLVLYADDTTLYCNINPNISVHEITLELEKRSHWLLSSNKLFLNEKKTKFMEFHMAQRKLNIQNVYLTMFRLKWLNTFFEGILNGNRYDV